MSRAEGLVLALVFALPINVLLVVIAIGYLGELPQLQAAPDWHTLVTLRNAEIAAIEIEQTLDQIEVCGCDGQWIELLVNTSRR